MAASHSGMQSSAGSPGGQVAMNMFADVLVNETSGGGQSATASCSDFAAARPSSAWQLVHSGMISAPQPALQVWTWPFAHSSPGSSQHSSLIAASCRAIAASLQSAGSPPSTSIRCPPPPPPRPPPVTNLRGAAVAAVRASGEIDYRALPASERAKLAETYRSGRMPAGNTYVTPPAARARSAALTTTRGGGATATRGGFLLGGGALALSLVASLARERPASGKGARASKVARIKKGSRAATKQRKNGGDGDGFPPIAAVAVAVAAGGAVLSSPSAKKEADAAASVVLGDGSVAEDEIVLPPADEMVEGK